MTKVDTVLYEIMDNEINTEVTISSLDKMIYHAIYEIRYTLLKRPDEKIIFSFLKEFLDGSEIAEHTFWERLRTLEIKGEIVNKPSKKGNYFFLSKSNWYASFNSSDISYNQFLSSTPLCPQNLGHDSSIISEEIEALDKIFKASRALLETLLKNVLALKHKRVVYHLQSMWIPGLGPMTIYFLWWQIKVQRLIATAINL